MNPQTAHLVRALGSVNQHMPRVVSDVLIGQMPAAKQHDFADLLVELGELLHHHAETQQAQAPAAPGDIASPSGFLVATDSEEEQP
jgi:hypothetical protein